MNKVINSKLNYQKSLKELYFAMAENNGSDLNEELLEEILSLDHPHRERTLVAYLVSNELFHSKRNSLKAA